MAKQLNKRLVGGVLLVGMVCVLGAGVALLSRLPERDPAKHVERAKEFYAKGNLDAAAKEYVQAFKYDSGNADHLVRAAEIAWEGGDSRSAQKFLQRAITIGQSESAQRLMLEIYAALARTIGAPSLWAGALEQANKIIPSDPAQREAFEKSKPHDAALAYVARGEATLTRVMGGNPDPRAEATAVDDLRRVIFASADGKRAPLEPANRFAGKALRDYWLSVAANAWTKAGGKNVDIAADLSNAAAAMGAVAKAAEASPDNPDLAETKLLLLVPFRMPAGWDLPAPLLCVFDPADKAGVMQILKETEDWIARLSKMPARNLTESRRLVELALVAGDYYQRLGEPERAESVLRAAIKEVKTDARPYQVLGLLLRQQGKPDEEAAVYKDALAMAKGERGFREDLQKATRAMIYDQSVTLEIVRRAKSKDDKVKAAALARAEEISKQASAELGQETPIIRLIRARLMREREQLSAATKELEQIDRDPNARALTVDIKALLWDLYSRQGLQGAAEKQARVLMSTGSPQAAVMLARTQLVQRQDRAALDTLNNIADAMQGRAAQSPEMNEIYALRAEAYQRLGMRAEAEREANRVKTKDSPTAGPLRDALLAMDRGRLEEAETKITQVLTADPANEDGLQAMQSLARLQKQPQKFIPWLKKAIAAKPEDKVLQNLLTFMDPNTTDAQRRELRLASLKELEDPFERAVAIYYFHRAAGETTEALKALDEAEKLKPDNPLVIEEQFNQAIFAALSDTTSEPAKRWERAEAYARKATEKNVDQADGKTYQGRLLLAKMDNNPGADAAANADLLGRAVELLRVGLESYPSNPIAWTHLGEAYQRTGRLNEARAAFQRAVALQPNNGMPHWGLSMVARQEGNTDEMEKEVTLAYNDPQLQHNPQVKAVYDEVQESRDPARGITRREAVRKTQPDDIQNLVMLANLYDKAGRPDDALNAFKDAVAKKPESLPANLSLARYYQKTSRCAEGIALLEGMLKGKLTPIEKITAAVSAARLYENCEVPQAAPKAEALYQLAHQTEPSCDTATEMAAFYSRTGRVRESVKWFEEARDRAGKTPGRAQALTKEIIRAALILRDVAKADKLLEEYQNKYKDDSDALMLEGSLALIKGDATDALSVFTDAIRRQPDNAMAYWQRGMLYALIGDNQHAVEDLRKARELAPNPPRLPTYQHRVQLAQALSDIGRQPEAIEELRTAMEDALAAKADGSQIGPIAAAASEMLLSMNPPRYAEAEKVLLNVSARFPTDPTWLLQLAKLSEDQEDYATAIQRNTDALQLSRRDATGAYTAAALQSLVRCHQSLGQPAKVVELLSSPENAPIVAKVAMLGSQLAMARWANGDESGGIAGLLAAAKPMSANPLGLRTMMLTALRDVPLDALLARTKAEVAARPDDIVAVKLYASELLEKNLVTEAEGAGKKLLDAGAPAADRSFMLFLLASNLYTQGKAEEACARYHQLIEVDPKNVWALNNYSFALASDLHRAAEGLAYAEQAAAQRPEDPTFLDTLGWCQTLAGKYAEARGTLFRALRVQPNYLDARMHLGLTYKLEGKNIAAAKQNLEVAAALAAAQVDASTRSIARREARLGSADSESRKTGLKLELSMLKDANKELAATQARITKALAELNGSGDAARAP